MLISQCSVTCGRVSFVFGLHGPCASFDTACSASLVANHTSSLQLLRYQCESALSAGVNMILDPTAMRINAVAGFTSRQWVGRILLMLELMDMLAEKQSM